MSGSGQRILVLDDDRAVVEYLCESLLAEGYDVAGMTSATEALARARKENFDLIITDVEMPELRGLEFLSTILEARPTQLVLLITAFGSVEMAVQAVRAGASDFLTKPFKIESLLHSVERAFTERALRKEIVRLRASVASHASGRVIAKSNVMRRVLDLAVRAAQSDTSILITGETGTGKSVLARYVHEGSKRREKPFVQLNCAAMPASLAESELFGVRRGAFTDAREDRPGMFVSAQGGTLFLDEIGELPLEIQAKLLHTLEVGKVRPLGTSMEVVVDTRLITATNRIPEQMLREGTFRPDLYYRVNVIRIDVPPLRERRDDILPLVDAFLSGASERHHRPLIGISASAMRLLLHHSWPGNVRELANVIERAVSMAQHDTILPEDLDFPSQGSPPSVSPPTLSDAARNGLSLEEVERSYIEEVLETQGGNKAAAAKILGITRRTLYRKLGH